MTRAVTTRSRYPDRRLPVVTLSTAAACAVARGGTGEAASPALDLIRAVPSNRQSLHPAGAAFLHTSDSRRGRDVVPPQLMLAVFRVNSALGRYVMRFVDADTGRGDEIIDDDEHVLADLVTSVAEDIRARAVRREHLAAGAVPATKTRHDQEVHRPRPPVVPPTPEPLDGTLNEDAVTRWPFGSFDEIIEALQQPVRWGDEP